MDSGDRCLLEVFRESLRARTDSFWELLACSAGHQAAVRRVAAGLTGAALQLGAHGPAIAPSIVRERIEALAAFDLREIAVLARGWDDPKDTVVNPFLKAAWSTAWRHLPVSMRHGNRYPFDNFGARDNAPISWDEAVSIVRRAAIFLPTDFAVLATRPLQNTTITAADIRDLPLGFLRLLRNRDDLLDSAARCWLRSLVGTAHHLDAWEAAVVLERIVAISPVDLGLVRKNFRDQLSELEDPRDVIPSTYVLLGTGWTVP